ncbi:DUF4349 domain-containing protein [Microbacterium sp. H1-D42]|uniref:DUF4349 domain-containing protein n=1 Tax=Microbacterium sp. H1-D42 TaxID=2925844 RepID=UPI001F53311E|nr:DUF4349 domain-containing protein [Microbacterium sp. H1-D42]UNK69434.1 DUF4349 domain-containing protein [Microbacterium sp. H1-D42]
MSENQMELPPLSEQSIARIERAVFAEIDDERPMPAATSSTAVRARRRRRRWVTGLGIAAAFVGGILIAPPLLNAVAPSGVGAVSYDSAVREVAPLSPEGADMAVDGAAGGDAEASSADASTGAGAAAEDQGREIISTADMTLQVQDVARSVDALGALAADNGGYVEATDVGLSPDAAMETVPGAPRQSGSGWISIRVPAADLTAVMSAVGDEGEVLRSSVSRQDVTSTVVDLQARVDSGTTSVKRLTELMGKSASVADLIAAESALTQRQAQLESDQQQLKGIGEQVAMATISIQLTEQTTTTTADPAGFTDGLLAGWNGLIVSLNAVVVAVGFLLPWLVIAGVVVLVIWLVRRRRTPAAGAPEASE